LVKSKRRLLGDLSSKDEVERMIRVNHAGEYGAVRIYQGQLKVLQRKPISKVLREMLNHEEKHLLKFESEIVKRKIRPTALLPFWHLCGYALGAGSALLGEKAAMACTVAVEEVIDEHYSSQIDALSEKDDEKLLRDTFVEFRDDELEHKDTGLSLEADKLPGYKIFTGAIKKGSRLAIWLSTRL